MRRYAADSSALLEGVLLDGPWAVAIATNGIRIAIAAATASRGQLNGSNTLMAPHRLAGSFLLTRSTGPRLFRRLGPTLAWAPGWRSNSPALPRPSLRPAVHRRRAAISRALKTA